MLYYISVCLVTALIFTVLSRHGSKLNVTLIMYEQQIVFLMVRCQLKQVTPSKPCSTTVSPFGTTTIIIGIGIDHAIKQTTTSQQITRLIKQGLLLTRLTNRHPPLGVRTSETIVSRSECLTLRIIDD